MTSPLRGSSDEALAYLQKQLGEGWACSVFHLESQYNEDSGRWSKEVFRATASSAPCRARVESLGLGPDAMSSARACVEAWREATLGVVADFVRRVNARAEADMLAGNPVTGAHHRAIEAEFARRSQPPHEAQR